MAKAGFCLALRPTAFEPKSEAVAIITRRKNSINNQIYEIAYQYIIIDNKPFDTMKIAASISVILPIFNLQYTYYVYNINISNNLAILG